MSLAAWVKVLRPKQYAKNLLVFAALLFTGNFKDPAQTLHAVEAFIAMCLIASATYIFNDLKDLERDRAHPVKKNRPIASGKIPPTAAAIVGVILLVLSLGIGETLGKASISLLVIYAGMQIAYNLKLKHIPITDVFIIALGFILRATLGAAAVGVTITSWLLLCTGALALMLGFAKRRHEFILQGDDRGKSRESLDGYTLQLLDIMVTATATSSAICYAMYASESRTAHAHPLLLLTSLFVFYGISRYLYLVFGKNEGGEPETLLFKDPHILFTVLGFVIVTLIAIKYGHHLPMVEFSN